MREENNDVSVIDCFGSEQNDSATPTREFTLQRFSLTIASHADVMSLIALNAFTHVVTALGEVRTARAERRDRTSLWPLDEGNSSESNAVISGHMRELMTFAQRVAHTTVNVLITGESGTG